MELEREMLVARLVALVNRQAFLMQSPPPEEWPEIELTMLQLRTLVLLSRCPRRMSDIAAHLGTVLSSATSLVERLEAKGLVERVHDPSDRRVVLCRLTSHGEDALDRTWRFRQSRIEDVAGLLTDDELALVVRAMEAVSAAVSRASDRTDTPTCDTERAVQQVSEVVQR